MRKKILILLSSFFILILLGLFSCYNECGPFPNNTPNKYKIVGLDWRNYKATYSDTAARLILSKIDNDSVGYKDYSIFIAPRQETYFAQNSIDWDFNLIQSAYACSFEPVILTTDEKIDSIVIISETTFNKNYLSGKDLSDLFDVVVLNDPNVYYEKYDLNNYLATKPNVPFELTLILKEQPELTTDFEFLVKYYQQGIDDNDFFEFTTNKLVIKRDD